MDQPHDQLRFSVIVPAYNEAAYLDRALGSLLHQDYDGEYEVIVVDNNSCDDTAAIAAQYGVQVVTEPQQGVCAARQRGVDCARGEIIISTDADTTSREMAADQRRSLRSSGGCRRAGPLPLQDPSGGPSLSIALFGCRCDHALTGFVFT